MKSLVVFSCLFMAAAIVRADEEEKKFHELMKTELSECFQELNLDKESMKKMEGAELNEEQQHQIGCLRACVMKKGKIMVDSKIDEAKVNGVIEMMHEGHPDEIAKRTQITPICIAEVKDLTDECEIGGKFGKCYMDKVKEL